MMRLMPRTAEGCRGTFEAGSTWHRISVWWAGNLKRMSESCPARYLQSDNTVGGELMHCRAGEICYY